MFKKLLCLTIAFLFYNNILYNQCNFNKFENKTDLTCGENGTISFSYTPCPKGAKFILYKDGSPYFSTTALALSVSNLSEGTYRIFFTDSNTQCYDSSNTFILSKSAASMSIDFAIDSPLCNTSSDGNVSVIVSNGVPPYSFKWSNNDLDSQLLLISSGNYTVTVNDNNGCSIIKTILVKNKERENITLTVESLINESCSLDNGEIKILAEGGKAPFKYFWSHDTNFNDSTELKNLSEGQYTVIVTDSYACDSVTKSFQITNITNLDVKIIGLDSICPLDGTTTLKAEVSNADSNNLTYLWEYDNSTNKELMNVDVGTYKVYVKYNDSCIDSAEKEIFAYPEKNVQIIGDHKVVSGLSTVLNIDSTQGLTNFSWSPTKNTTPAPNMGLNISPTDTTLYTFTAFYGPNCKLELSFMVEIEDALDSIVIPNIFTPNNNSTNDRFKLKGFSNVIFNFEFKVFDKWGNNVFNAYDKNFEWDGKNIDGKELESSTYYYIMKFNNLENKFDRKIQKGQILLYR